MEARIATGHNNRTHGRTNSKEWKAWHTAKDRCFNPHNRRYKAYGGRGISMCKEWRNSFEAFYAHMGDAPPKHTLDRINNDRWYEPGNCRWATFREQAINRSNTRLYEVDGITRCVREWAIISGIPITTLHRWLNAGIPMADAIKRKPARA